MTGHHGGGRREAEVEGDWPQGSSGLTLLFLLSTGHLVTRLRSGRRFAFDQLDDQINLFSRKSNIGIIIEAE